MPFLLFGMSNHRDHIDVVYHLLFGVSNPYRDRIDVAYHFLFGVSNPNTNHDDSLKCGMPYPFWYVKPES